METKRFEDIDLRAVGHEVVMTGIVFQGHTLGGQGMVVMFPTQGVGAEQLVEVQPSLEQWLALLKQTDELEREAEVLDEGGKIAHAFLRKGQRQMDAQVMWDCYRRDSFSCCYCGAIDRPLTVDHLIPWELRGPSILLNLLSSCKRDNRRRGNMSFAHWLQSGYYAEVSAGLTEERKAANLALLDTLGSIPLVKRQRSR